MFISKKVATKPTSPSNVDMQIPKISIAHFGRNQSMQHQSWVTTGLDKTVAPITVESWQESHLYFYFDHQDEASPKHILKVFSYSAMVMKSTISHLVSSLQLKFQWFYLKPFSLVCLSHLWDSYHSLIRHLRYNFLKNFFVSYCWPNDKIFLTIIE